MLCKHQRLHMCTLPQRNRNTYLHHILSGQRAQQQRIASQMIPKTQSLLAGCMFKQVFALRDFTEPDKNGNSSRQGSE